MRFGYLLGVAAIASVMGASNANADIVYSIDLPSIEGGPYSFSISGTITTNGTTGALSSSDFASVDITVSNSNGSSVTINSLSELQLYGTALTATGTGVYFGFNNSSFSYFNGLDGGEYGFCFSGVQGSGCYPGQGEALFTPDGNDAQQLYSDNMLIAQAVPEPGTLALLGMALFAVGGLSLRRKFG